MPGSGSRSPQRRRLTRSGDFRRAFRDGYSKATRYLVLYRFPKEGGGESRLGVSVSRKLGGAVDRNRIKRVLREAFWSLGDELDGGEDFVIVARRDLAKVVEEEGEAGAGRCLREVLGLPVPEERST